MSDLNSLPRQKPQGRPLSGLGRGPGYPGSLDPDPQKISEANQPLAKAKTDLAKKPRSLVWERINPVTWRLADPDAPQVLVSRSHGQWAGFKTPAATAWVFNVGDDERGVDWRIRVQRREGWRAAGSVGDLELVKQIVGNLVNGGQS